jgi:hypothetical protein
VSRIGRLFSYLRRICLQDKFPVWVTILGVVIGGVATAASTYWIVPSINETLEKQRIRSEFVIRNLDDLNARTRALVSDVSAIHQSVLRANVVDDSMVQKALLKITEMQWKAVELAIIFDGSAGERIIENYQQSLDSVRDALSSLRTREDLSSSQAAIERLSARTVEVVRELASLAGLRVKNLRSPRA